MGERKARVRACSVALFAVACVLAIGGCAGSGSPQPSPVAGADCVPTDQDAYVWRPARLQLVQPCLRVEGVVRELGAGEADGDVHVNVELDAQYRSVLAPGNDFVDGNLVVEAVCQSAPAHVEALRVCASDPNPYSDPFPKVGEHIWLEGRNVLDLWHHAWAELHPLYRWGPVTP